VETRASYIAVGGFVLVLIAVLVAFVAWLTRTHLERASDRYLVYFSGAVSGLQPGSPVRYLGIPVGTVGNIEIDPEDVRRVRVTVDINQGTPIKTNSVASLELQGLTGGVFIQISSGSQEAPLLAEQDWPRVIPSRPSNLAALFDATPLLLENMVTLTRRATNLFSEENQRALTEILVNVQTLSEQLAGVSTSLAPGIRSGEQALADVGALTRELRAVLPGILQDVDSAAEQARRTMASFENTSRSLEKEIGQSGGDLREMLKSIRRTSDQLAALVSENREPVRDFTGTGLYEVTQLLNELRDLVGSLSRFTLRLERDPAGALLGGTRNGVETRR